MSLGLSEVVRAWCGCSRPARDERVNVCAVLLSLTAGIVLAVPNIQTFIVNAIKVSYFSVISWHDGIKCVKFRKNITFYGETFTDGTINLCCEKVILLCFYVYDSSVLLHSANLIQEIPSVVLYIEASYSSVLFKHR